MSLEEQMLKMVDQKHLMSAGKCGLKPTDIPKEVGEDYQVIRSALNKLFKEKKILVRKGINGLLIFKQHGNT